MSDKLSREVDFEKLRFIRVFTPMHVPKGLIEQVRDREYEVEDWYRYQEIICMRDTANGKQLNPLSMLYVIADEDNKVVGMLWCEVDALGKTLIVQTFSMDKREHKVDVAALAKLPEKGASVGEFVDSLPDFLGAQQLKRLAGVIADAANNDKPVFFAMGAHVIKVGCSPIIIDLMKRGVLAGIALNGAGGIHYGWLSVRLDYRGQPNGVVWKAHAPHAYAHDMDI